MAPRSRRPSTRPVPDVLWFFNVSCEATKIYTYYYCTRSRVFHPFHRYKTNTNKYWEFQIPEISVECQTLSPNYTVTYIHSFLFYSLVKDIPLYSCMNRNPFPCVIYPSLYLYLLEHLEALQWWKKNIYFCVYHDIIRSAAPIQFNTQNYHTYDYFFHLYRKKINKIKYITSPYVFYGAFFFFLFFLFDGAFCGVVIYALNTSR